jgi:hypothetical protein
MLTQNVFVSTDEEAACSTGWIKNPVVFGGINDFDYKIDNVTRGSKLTRTTLARHYRKQIFVCIPKLLWVGIIEKVDFIQKETQNFRLAIRQVSAAQYFSK